MSMVSDLEHCSSKSTITPTRLSHCSKKRLLSEITMNWSSGDLSLRYRVTFSMFGLSNAASISSRTQKGDGLYLCATVSDADGSLRVYILLDGQQ